MTPKYTDLLTQLESAEEWNDAFQEAWYGWQPEQVSHFFHSCVVPLARQALWNRPASEGLLPFQ